MPDVRRRLQADGRRCAYIDAAGYAHALDLALPLLTGDAAFQDLEGVEFLKETTTRKH